MADEEPGPKCTKMNIRYDVISKKHSTIILVCVKPFHYKKLAFKKNILIK